MNSHFTQFNPPDITDREFWESVKYEPHYARIVEQIFSITEDVATHPPILHATDYLAAKRYNDRSPSDRHWRGDRVILSALMTRRLLEGVSSTDLDDRLLNWFWAFFTQTTWCVSPHLPGGDLPELGGTPLLDLAACEWAVHLAEARELLKPWMDSVSDTLAKSIVHEIAHRILIPYGEGIRVGWEDPLPGKYFNNWIGVCGGSLLAACESLAKQGFHYPKARARALKSLDTFFNKAFTEHGECDEGVAYWGYGLEFASAGLSRLDSKTFHQNYDLQRLRLVADYPRRAHLFEDQFFSGNDSSIRAHARGSSVLWLGHVFENDFLLDWYSRYPDESKGWTFSQWVRDLYWEKILGKKLNPTSTSSFSSPTPRLLEDQQTAIIRLKNPQGDLWACLTAGNNGERHNHNDLGHFLIACNDEWIIPDLGKPVYPRDFFGPKRYTYLPASSRGHNCPIINGQEQRAGLDARGKIVEWKSNKTGYLCLDLTEAYPPEAELDKWTRSLTENSNQIQVIDYFKAKKDGIPIQHGFWSIKAPKIKSASEVQLGSIVVRLDPAPTQITIQAVSKEEALLMKSMEDPLRLMDVLADTFYRIEADYATDINGELRISTFVGF